MKTLPPDLQTVTFRLYGVTYQYVGSTQEVTVLSKDGWHIDLRDMINMTLRTPRVVTHIPADQQIREALALMSEQPEELQYVEDQSEDNTPADAIS
jgi:hypothetical protein